MPTTMQYKPEVVGHLLNLRIVDVSKDNHIPGRQSFTRMDQGSVPDNIKELVLAIKSILRSAFHHLLHSTLLYASISYYTTILKMPNETIRILVATVY